MIISSATIIEIGKTDGYHRNSDLLLGQVGDLDVNINPKVYASTKGFLSGVFHSKRYGNLNFVAVKVAQFKGEQE